MPSISQRVPNFFGGVSQQPDELKFPGQLRDSINTLPEPALGLIKRPGAKYIAELKDNSNNVLAPSVFNNGKWFSIFRDDVEKYIGVIYGTTIRIWSAIDGTPRTVTYGTGATGYLTGTLPEHYDVLTVNDYTFITNRTVAVTAQAAPSYNYGRRATIVLQTVAYGCTYSVKINATTVTYTTYQGENIANPPTQTQNQVNENVILDSLVASINGIGGGISATRYGYTIEVTGTSSFTISIGDSIGGEGMRAYQDSVPDTTYLSPQTVNGRIVKVANSSAPEDDYYLKFFADNGVSGTGYWEETIKPDASPGLTIATLPHELIRNGDGSFTFRRASWEDRLIGDDVTNPHPSILGKKLQTLFFYNDRFGLLADDNILFSQSGEFFNLYRASALAYVESDPIDVTASSTKPAKLTAAVPVAQGLLLFSRTQQFLLTGGEQGFLAPDNVTVKVISNFEMAANSFPTDLGTTIAFLVKTPSYCRVFEMQTRGQNESPDVLEISKVIPEWIPSTVDQVVSSPQNNILSLGSTSSRYLYLYRFFGTGDNRDMQGWFRWQMSGNVLHHAMENDNIYVITKQKDSVILSYIPLVQSPTTSTFVTQDGSKVDPRLDCWFQASGVTYNNGSEFTQIPVNYKYDDTLEICAVTTGSGQVYLPEVITSGGNFFLKIPGADISTETFIVGYTYKMEVDIPRIFFRQGDRQQITDWTAYLTIARLKFLFGLSGDVDFYTKSFGRQDWNYSQTSRFSDSYAADDIPILKSSEYSLSVHQRAEHFDVKLLSETPFPVSLLSMVWEGNYSRPRYSRS